MPGNEIQILLESFTYISPERQFQANSRYQDEDQRPRSRQTNQSLAFHRCLDILNATHRVSTVERDWQDDCITLLNCLKQCLLKHNHNTYTSYKDLEKTALRATPQAETAFFIDLLLADVQTLVTEKPP